MSNSGIWACAQPLDLDSFAIYNRSPSTDLANCSLRHRSIHISHKPKYPRYWLDNIAGDKLASLMPLFEKRGYSKKAEIAKATCDFAKYFARSRGLFERAGL